MIDKDKILTIVRRFVNDYFPHAHGVMITGSFLTDKFNETSDIDIIILSNIFRSVCIDTYDYDGIKMQCIIFPVYDLESLIKYDMKNGGVFICQVSKGVILKDHENVFANFKAKVQILYNRGPAQISRFTLNQYRSRLTTRLEDLEGCNDFYDNTFTIIDTYHRILDAYFGIKQHWAYSGKTASRELENIDPLFKVELVKSLSDFFIYKDHTSIIRFLKKFVDFLGGPISYMSTKEISDICKDNCLTIFISATTTNITENFFANCEIVIRRAQQIVCKNLPQIKMSYYFSPDKLIYKTGLYIMFYGDKTVLNEEVLPRVEVFHLSLYNTGMYAYANNFYYPFFSNLLTLA